MVAKILRSTWNDKMMILSKKLIIWKVNYVYGNPESVY